MMMQEHNRHLGGSIVIDVEPFHQVSVEMLESDVDQPMTV